MLSVSVLRDNNLWENYFVEKPLTLEEFVNKSPTLNDSLFPHLKDLIHTLSEKPIDEIYFQTPIATGKSTVEAIICAYHMYLFGIFKNIDKTLGFAPTISYSFGILGTRKTCKLALESLFNIFQQIPIFSKLRYLHDDNSSNRGKICYCTNCENALMDIFYIAPNGSRSVPLKVIPIQSAGDLLGSTMIGAYFSEVSSFLEVTGKNSKDVFEIINKASHRIDSRFGPRDEFLHTFILDKAPYDKEEDIIDAYIQSISPLDEHRLVVNFKPRWELFPKEYEKCNYIWLDIYSEKIVKDKTKHTFRVPEQYRESIKYNPKQFIRDYLGIPTSLIENPSITKLKKFKSDLIYNNIGIIMKKGNFYFVDKETGMDIGILELFW